MSKLIGKFILLGFLVVAVLLLIGNTLRVVIHNSYVTSVQTQLSVVKGKVELEPVEYLIIGDSTALTQFPYEIFPSVRNIALRHSSWVETYFSVKRYLENHASPKYVLVSAILSGSQDDLLSHFIDAEFYSLSERMEIYRTCSKYGSCADNLFTKAKVVIEYFLTLNRVTADSWRSLRENPIEFSSLFSTRKTIKPDSLDKLNLAYPVNSKLNQKRTRYYEKNFKQLFVLDKTNRYYLKQTLRLLKERKIPLIYNEFSISTDTFSVDKLGILKKLRLDTVSEIDNIEENTIWHRPFELPKKWFYDPAHLNQLGVCRYVKEYFAKTCEGHCDPSRINDKCLKYQPKN